MSQCLGLNLDILQQPLFTPGSEEALPPCAPTKNAPHFICQFEGAARDNVFLLKQNVVSLIDSVPIYNIRPTHSVRIYCLLVPFCGQRFGRILVHSL